MYVCVVCVFAKSNQPHAIKLDNYDVLTYFNAVLWNGIRMNNVVCLCLTKTGYEMTKINDGKTQYTQREKRNKNKK